VLRILSSEDILAYGVGLYSFFSNHNVSCLGVNVENCQTQIFVVDAGVNPSFHEQFDRQSRVRLYNLNTVGSVSMINFGGKDVAFQADNAGDFPENVALFTVG
jgi:glucan 1,3-beta-glucosidase